MSGIIGHTMYALLAGRAAAGEKLPIAPLIHRHYASYLAGSYLGCDVQTLPASICVDTGEEVGYGGQTIEKSPLTGGAVKPWVLRVGAEEYRPRDIHGLFYGRAHLVLGLDRDKDKSARVSWERLPDYFAAVIADARARFGPGERRLAYVFGWMTHVVGDALIKSVRPGVTMRLLDGLYTPSNRPIQDLVTFHEIGRNELQLNWADLLADLVETPIEAVQLHYMRVSRPGGELAREFPDAWLPGQEGLLLQVLAANRRYQRTRNSRLLEQYALKKTKGVWECDQELSDQTGGLRYAEMVELAEAADFRHALWQIADGIVQVFKAVLQRRPELEEVTDESVPDWEAITAKWRA